MIENILIIATGPASVISSALTHRSVFWLIKYGTINALFGIILVPLLTQISLETYIEYTFGLVLSFLFGTIPFGAFDTAVNILGDKFGFIAAVIIGYYYIVLFLTIYFVFFEIVTGSDDDKLNAMTRAERLEHESRVEEHVRQHPNEFVNGASPTDPNDELLVFGLTTNRKIIEADVAANAIAKALRNNQ